MYNIKKINKKTAHAKVFIRTGLKSCTNACFRTLNNINIAFIDLKNILNNTNVTTLYIQLNLLQRHKLKTKKATKKNY